MARVDNHVLVLGRVVKGPVERYTKEGKLRISYQIQIEGRKIDKGFVQAPFVRSMGNLAEKDKENIKTGDLVLVEGRIVTRMEKKHVYFVKDEELGENHLKQIDPDDEECPVYPDEDIFEADIIRPVTEIFAEEVFYFHNFVERLSDDERKKMFSKDVLQKALKELAEHEKEEE